MMMLVMLCLGVGQTAKKIGENPVEIKVAVFRAPNLSTTFKDSKP
jgi:hypothetical protein